MISLCYNAHINVCALVISNLVHVVIIVGVIQKNCGGCSPASVPSNGNTDMKKNSNNKHWDSLEAFNNQT